MGSEIYETDEDLSENSGGILASWFVANPSGPTAYALGYVERGGEHDLFYKWVHFTGGRTWLIGSYDNDLETLGSDIGELVFNAIIRAHNFFCAQDHREVPILSVFPSFVITNGNPMIDHGLVELASHSLRVADWAGELFLIDRFGSSFFEKAGWQIRNAYERGIQDPNGDKERLQYIFNRYQGSGGWDEWALPDLPEIKPDPALVQAWFGRITDERFVADGLENLAKMWVGAVWQAAHGGLLEQLKADNRYTSFSQLSSFFDQFQLPLWPEDWNDKMLCERLGLSIDLLE